MPRKLSLVLALLALAASLGFLARSVVQIMTAPEYNPESATAAAPWTTDTPRDDVLKLIRVSDAPTDAISLDDLFALLSDRDAFAAALVKLNLHFSPRDTAPLLEIARFTRDPQRRALLYALLAEHTGQDLETDHDAWLQWLWAQPYAPRADYGMFKAALYADIDPRFVAYFDDHTDDARIRLDEVRWGGVRQNGIPPLINPAMITADAADYLDDDHVVFGLKVNGDARAYPKRILAWHEMFKDTVGGEAVNGVYCTLCGSMILYRTTVDGTHYELGTSGFLYRSNKLMFDEATHSMWSTLTGEPVIGPLVGQGIKLEPLSVVTTTWGRWKQQHPDTTVLALDTGFHRDYGEGVAYREYFATDRLMFTVPQLDDRLLNKDEVLALRFGGPDAPPTVIATGLLAQHPVYENTLGDTRYVVLTDEAGANRVYALPDGVAITGFDGDTLTATDDRGRRYAVQEDALVPQGENTNGTPVLPRLSAHRAFWFGWHAAHPDTVLIQ